MTLPDGEAGTGKRGSVVEIARILRLSALCICGLSISLLSSLGTVAEDEPANQPRAAKLATQNLPNAIRLHPQVISGGMPADAAAFEELKQLGVKTIISVDGATPDVALAKQFGLRYVHLPHGYDGIPDHRAMELAKAVRELDGPIYIHCHHGKHRSPAAASVACVSAGLLAPAQALSILELAGTNPHYRGLFRSVTRAQPVALAELDQFEAHFTETALVPPLAERMVALEHSLDQLQKLLSPKGQPPLSGSSPEVAHEALLLREHFTEMLRGRDFDGNAQYRKLLSDSERVAERLELACSMPGQAVASSELASQFQQLADICQACHAQFRDVPLDTLK